MAEVYLGFVIARGRTFGEAISGCTAGIALLRTSQPGYRPPRNDNPRRNSAEVYSWGVRDAIIAAAVFDG